MRNLTYVIIILLLVSCRHIVSKKHHEIITAKVKIQTIESDKDLKVYLDTIYLYNTVKDTLVLNTHDDLNIDLVLSFYNNSKSIWKLDFEKDSIKGIFRLPHIRDTLSFFRWTNPQNFILVPGDSVHVGLGMDIYNLEKLFKDNIDYEEDMISFISNFHLVYVEDGKYHNCVNQGSQTEIVLINNESSWKCGF